MDVINSDVIVALIGAVSSILIARLSSNTKDGGRVQNPKFWIITSIGLALTALLVSLVSFNETNKPQFEIIKTTITAHTKGTRGDEKVPHFIAPPVPEPAQEHPLSIQCNSGYDAIAAWHEIIGSHPSSDAMYTVNPNVKNGKASIHLRARTGVAGYAYVEILVLCSRLTQ
ncbi:MAG: hypothetical protein OIF58_05185 [Cohaesibacter sp.]|nr:hypothetical protein [Cohaesibacter sp.]